MRHNYPFVAIVGQEQLKQALLLCAVDPTLGGLLIRGDKGSAKSTAARGLTEILPAILRVPGCAFNCSPDAPLKECPQCQPQISAPVHSAVPFINLPLGATEDRVLGSLDFERALRDGHQAFKPGLLASAHRGLLYIDEVNLLADHLVDVLLDVAAMGVNTVQREGLSISHPARITLLGTMNQEEGELRPQLLDRFGLMVDVSAPRDPLTRAEVVRRRLAFEADPQGFGARWQPETEALRHTIVAAQRALSTVELSDSLFAFISQLCCEFEVASLRADIVMHKAARAIAALDQRQQVSAEDVRAAAELALPHRRRRKPFEQSGLDRERLDQLTQQQRQSNPPPDTDTPPQPSNANAPEPESAPNSQPDAQAPPTEETAPQAPQQFAAQTAEPIARIQIESLGAHDASGRRSNSQNSRRGHYVRAVPNPEPGQLALDATLRHALQRNPGHFQVTRADLHGQVKAGKHGNLILLVVDASGSMAARQRMEKVKGCVLGLLQDAYQRRDHVAVIAFRGTSAELVLPPTQRIEQAEAALNALPTGGRTPLAHALELAQRTLERQRGADALTPLLVLLSDGRANVPLDPDQDPWRQALELARQLSQRGTPALVLDSEQDFVRLGRARDLAQALSAEYLPLDQFSSQQLTLSIRERLRQ